jgi:hypothetical protein
MIRRDNKSGIEHVYFNSRIDNIYGGDEYPKLCSSNQKTGIILERQRDYEMAISFFRCNGDIPILFCPIEEGPNTDINRTNYGVCFSYAGNDYPARLQFTFEGIVGPPFPAPKAPNENNGTQDFSTGYYGIYTFQHFINMTNTAWQTAYTAFNTAHPGIHNSAPWFQYDPITGLISLITEFSYSVAGNATIAMNALLYNYYEAIRVNFNGFNMPNFRDYTFQIVHLPGNQNAYALPGAPVIAPPANPAYLRFTQEYDTRYLWQNITSLLITSPSIQMRSEYLPNAYNPNTGNTIPPGVKPELSTFNPNFNQVLSYFDIFTEPGRVSVREPIYYNPQVLKWIDLIGDSPLNQVAINVYMILNNGVVLPLYLQSEANNGFDIKFEFRRKLF